MSATRTVRIEHGDVVKMLLFRRGAEPSTYDQFLSCIAAKIPAIGLGLATRVLRLWWMEPGTDSKVALEEDDDLVAMFDSLAGAERITVVASLEEVNQTNRHLLLPADRLGKFLGTYLGRPRTGSGAGLPAPGSPPPQDHDVMSNASTVYSPSRTDAPELPYPTHMAMGRWESRGPSIEGHRAFLTGTKVAPPGPGPGPGPAPVPGSGHTFPPDAPAAAEISPSTAGRRALATLAPVPSDREWDLLVRSKRSGAWTSLRIDIERDQLTGVIKAWDHMRGIRGRKEMFSQEVLDVLVKINPAYTDHFPHPDRVPALIVMDGVAAEAAAVHRSPADHRFVVAELVWLGARHARYWNVGTEDFRAMIVAILHVLSTHQSWVPDGAHDVLAYRAVLCEMVAVMSRGLVAGPDEVAQVREWIQNNKDSAAAGGAGAARERRRGRCKVM